jgi:hypothetical protein
MAPKPAWYGRLNEIVTKIEALRSPWVTRRAAGLSADIVDSPFFFTRIEYQAGISSLNVGPSRWRQLCHTPAWGPGERLSHASHSPGVHSSGENKLALRAQP